MPHDDSIYLHHILDAIVQIEEYVGGHTKESFVVSAITQDAVIRQLEIIGEAGKRVSSYLRARHAEVLTTFVGGSTIRALTCSTLLGPRCSENTQDAVSVVTASARAYGSSRISGCFSATTSSFSAASLGVRRPCSQSWMVRALTLSSFANMD